MEATQQRIDVLITNKQYHQFFEEIKRFYRRKSDFYNKKKPSLGVDLNSKRSENSLSTIQGLIHSIICSARTFLEQKPIPSIIQINI
jgi:hypothetical protein